jgi:hypothetical protein
VTVRYQADADLKRVILLAVARKEPTVDFRSATEAGLVALPDKEVLAAAAEAGRVLVSHDLKTILAQQVAGELGGCREVRTT